MTHDQLISTPLVVIVAQLEMPCHLVNTPPHRPRGTEVVVTVCGTVLHVYKEALFRRNGGGSTALILHLHEHYLALQSKGLGAFPLQLDSFSGGDDGGHGGCFGEVDGEGFTVVLLEGPVGHTAHVLASLALHVNYIWGERDYSYSYSM